MPAIEVIAGFVVRNLYNKASVRKDSFRNKNIDKIIKNEKDKIGNAVMLSGTADSIYQREELGRITWNVLWYLIA